MEAHGAPGCGGGGQSRVLVCLDYKVIYIMWKVRNGIADCRCSPNEKEVIRLFFVAFDRLISVFPGCYIWRTIFELCGCSHRRFLRLIFSSLCLLLFVQDCTVYETENKILHVVSFFFFALK